MIYRYIFPLSFALVTIFYAILGITPHFFFDSNAWDLGIFNQTLWHYTQGILGPNTLRNVDTLLADHFEILLFFFAPFIHIFDSYTLLIMQVLGIIFGGYGIYKIGIFLGRPQKQILIGIFMYFTFFGFTQAFSFDYHNNVFATGLIPWIYYFFFRSKLFLYSLIFIIFILSKENMGILGFAIGISLISFAKNKNEKIVSCISALVSLLVFIFLIKYFIPYFNGGHYSHWGYKSLGDDMFSSIVFLISNPINSLSILFDSDMKISTWIILFCSGLFLLFRPSFLIPLIVLISQKFFSSNLGISSYQFHYNVEFAPFIAISFLLLLDKKRYFYYLGIILIMINIVFISILPLYSGRNIFVHYSRYFSLYQKRETINNQIRNIPDMVSVSASNTIVPHISFRKNIYLFPNKLDSDYILIDLSSDNFWPFVDTNDRYFSVNTIKNDPRYTEIYSDRDLLFLKRTQS